MHSAPYYGVQVDLVGSVPADDLFGVLRLRGPEPPEGGTPNGVRDFRAPFEDGRRTTADAGSCPPLPPLRVPRPQPKSACRKE